MAMKIFLQQSTCAATYTSRRCQASQADARIISELKHERSSFPKHKPSRLMGDFNAGLGIRRNMKNAAVHAGVPPETPFPADPSPGHWKVWILGTIVTILLSFFTKGKWGPLLKLKDKVETTIERAEEVSDVVEEVAEKVEEVAEAASKHLPEGKLQDAAGFVEEVAEKIDEEAHLAGDVLEKVEEMGKEVDSFVDSSTHQDQTVDVSEQKAEDHK